MLDELPYGPGSGFRILPNEHFRSSLVDAIELYSSARRDALSVLYHGKELSETRTTEVTADFEEVAAICGHFSYSLQNFAEEMRVYLNVLDELKQEIERRPRQRTWKWLLFWRSHEQSQMQGHLGDHGKDLWNQTSELVY